jgi:hypothetical protein
MAITHGGGIGRWSLLERRLYSRALLVWLLLVGLHLAIVVPAFVLFRSVDLAVDGTLSEMRRGVTPGADIDELLRLRGFLFSGLVIANTVIVISAAVAYAGWLYGNRRAWFNSVVRTAVAEVLMAIVVIVVGAYSLIFLPR